MTQTIGKDLESEVSPNPIIRVKNKIFLLRVLNLLRGEDLFGLSIDCAFGIIAQNLCEHQVCSDLSEGPPVLSQSVRVPLGANSIIIYRLLLFALHFIHLFNILSAFQCIWRTVSVNIFTESTTNS